MKPRRKYECFECAHKRTIGGTRFISCVNEDPDLSGTQKGIDMGWFAYPWFFHPAFKAGDCAHFEKSARFCLDRNKQVFIDVLNGSTLLEAARRHRTFSSNEETGKARVQQIVWEIYERISDRPVMAHRMVQTFRRRKDELIPLAKALQPEHRL